MPGYRIICLVLWLAGGVFSWAREVSDTCLLTQTEQHISWVPVSPCMTTNQLPTIRCQTGRVVIDDVIVGVRPSCDVKTQDQTCCTNHPGDELYSGKCLVTSLTGKFYKRLLEDLLRACSGQVSCTIRSSWTLPVMRNMSAVNSHYTLVSYMCEKAIPNLDICQNTEIRGESLYLKFSSATVSDKDVVDCTCDIENTGLTDEVVDITAFDVRLYSLDKPDNCTESRLVIQGRQFNNSQCVAVLNTSIWSASLAPGSAVPLTLQHVTSAAPPSFVWLKIAAQANSTVLVNCKGPGSRGSEALSAFLIGIIVTCVTTVAVIIIIVVVCIYRWRHQFKCLRRQKEVEQPVYFEVQPTSEFVDSKPPLPASNPSTLNPPPKPLRAAQLSAAPLMDDNSNSSVVRKPYHLTELPPIPRAEEQYDLLLKKRSPTSPGNVYGGIAKNGKGKNKTDENPYALPGEKNPRGRSVVDHKYNKPDLLKS
ncbi:uncharacterized protein LOC121371888 [Gigantopelta aegis]|uniref:uncharacterized protein LOC121371888 n=1 Tax=Gigantopelta aegis TaxID=1735272 RepID=UPI001B889A9B|nr:uncharacterized protein LOC121371888 [Gigantopelta aegis]